MMCKRGLIGVLIFFFLQPIYTQKNHLQFTTLSIEDGLSHNCVNTILKDKDGYIWIGTDYGLNNYNGQSFRNYFHDSKDTNSISGNKVEKIYQDSKGRIWVGTWSGLNLYSPEKDNFKRLIVETDYTSQNSLNLISDILEVSDNEIWLGTLGWGINVLNTETWQFDRTINDIFKDNQNQYIINSIVKDCDGNVWISGTRATIDVYNPNDKTLKKIPIKGIKDESQYFVEKKIHFDKDSLLWISTEGMGAISYNKETGEFLTYPKVNYSVISEVIQYNDDILIGTDNGGINILNKKTNEIKYLLANQFDHQSLASNGIYELYIDNENILWVGTFDGGVNFYNPKNNKFQHYYSIPNIPGSLSYNNVSELCELPGGKILVGTDGGGVNIFDPESQNFDDFKIDNNSILNDNNITCITRKDDNVYISAFEKGIAVLDLKTRQVKELVNDETNSLSLSDNNVFAMCVDKNDNLWIGTLRSGIDVFDKNLKKVKSYSMDPIDPNAIRSNHIKTLYIDPNDRLWVGTLGGGLSLYNPDEDNFTNFSQTQDTENFLLINTVNSIFSDSNGNIWVGTNGGGLNKLDAESGKIIDSKTTNDGLPSNVINNIVEDDNGFLWMSTSNGLSKYSVDDNSFTNYNTGDGLQSKYFSETCCLKTQDGWLYFGGVNGFNRFRPSDIVKDTIIPNLVFTDFKIFNKSILPGGEDSPLQNHISQTKEIVLSYKENVISIEFVLLEYTNPDKVRYEYMLEGFEHNWNTTDNSQRLITYTSLPGGDYTFKLFAINPDGVRMDTPRELKIHVLPPFWATIWFRTIVVAVVILMVLIIIKIRTSMLTKQQKILKEAKEKAERSDKLKSAFLANMSHEIRTPMNVILGFLSLLDGEDVTKDKRAEYTELINESGKSLLLLIDDIIDISRIEAGEVKVNKEEFDLCQFFEDLLTEYILLFKKGKTKDVELRLSNSIGKNIFINTDKQRLKQILVNLIDNAWKFTEKGFVEFGLKKQGENLELFVKDTGIGIPNEHHNFIFDRFTKIEDNIEKLYRGTGLGLFITKKLVDMLGANISVDSTPDVGSVFTVSFPGDMVEIKEPIQHESTKHRIRKYWGGKKILIVDDELSNLRYLKEVLKKLDIEVFEARNGKEAIEIHQKITGIDLILMDIKMPVIDGMEATKVIRKQDKKIPIIAQTAFAMVDDRDNFIKNGSTDYIAKPIKKEELLPLLDQYLE